MSSLKDALHRKQQRETFFDVIVEDPTAAEEQYDKARHELRVVELRHGKDEPEVVAARAAVDEARAALSACTYRIVFHNLAPDEFEALVSAHPPTKEQQAEGDQWNGETFRPALIAACAADSDMTEADWVEELASSRWSVSDRTALFMAALGANVTPRSVTVPKG